MADGIVTSSDTEFRAMLAESPEPVARLALLARGLVFDVLPQTVEVVWPRQGVAGYGTGPKKMTEQFVWLAPHSKHLVFGFYYGAELPAPEGLLEGMGRLMRHVKIRAAADLANPELRQLVARATVHRVPPPRTA
ncbi:DUF1801 domain-containing protein [Actinotalea sp. M2MS4P-6]|uniref:DUF1801 domain-containing protein n=1 Tax=Actinotalea sp. M2MS4P-6 TaxID=2983762 RepID=UPI0021E37B08|nr:DUF1801 domain-containing protein [Actinotalea sp. M2MS4P-6]MCV2395317.1 DUF1801 domain-containing protein [Actinotalea sp. M2MS4P-6]